MKGWGCGLGSTMQTAASLTKSLDVLVIWQTWWRKIALQVLLSPACLNGILGFS